MDQATYKLELNFGQGWEDYTDKIILTDGYAPRLCIGKGGAHEIQTLTVKILQSRVLGLRLATAEDPIPARLFRNGLSVLTGIVRPYTTTKATLNRVEPISITILDQSATLEQYVFDSVRWTNLTLINRSDVGTSLIHKLFLEAGVSPSDILVSFDRPEVIPFYSLSNGEYISDRIQEVLFEYGLTYRATESGKFQIIDIAPEALIPEVTIGTADIRTELSLTRSDSSNKGAIVKWHPTLFRAQASVYEYDFADQEGVLESNGVFPPGSDIKGYRLPYDISSFSDGKILSVLNPSLSYSPQSLSAIPHTEFGEDDCRAYLESVSASNQNVSGFTISADVWYQGKNPSQQIVQGDKPKTYTAKVISDAGSAAKLARILSLRQTVGQQLYTFESRVSLTPGALVRVIEDEVSFFDVTVRILSKEFNPSTSTYTYKAEGTGPVDSSITVEEIEALENAAAQGKKGPPGPRGKSYRVEIESTAGLLLRPGEQYTTLIAHVYDDTGLITVDESTLIWSRKSQDPSGDEAWNLAHSEGSKELELTPADFFGQTSFRCDYMEVL